MFAIAVAVGLVSEKIDWKQFNKFVNNRIPVAKDTSSFESALKEQMTAFIKANAKYKNEEFFPHKIFRIENSPLVGFSMGNLFESGATYIARPNNGKYRIESVERVKRADRFVPEYGAMSSGRLVVSGQEHIESNYMSPAAASYHLENGKWKADQFQSTNFEGGVDQFEFRNSRWTSHASGRRYPENISVPHSGAEVIMERTFVARNGRLESSPEKPVPCVMKTMDDLIHAVQVKNWSAVNSLCVTPKLAKQLRVAAAHTKRDRWRPVNDFHGKSLSCQIPGTDSVTIVERFGKTWKLTKILKIPK